MNPQGPVGVVHMHSDYSHDGRDSLEDLREFALARGIRFVGLTDHAEDFRADVYSRYLEHCRRVSDDTVSLIPGLEFRFAGYPGLHLLALGLSAWITPDTPEAFMAATRGVAGFTILAHPVLPGYRAPAPVLEHIDAIEVWNTNYNTRYLPDARAIRWLQATRRINPRIVGTAGLDQHDRRNDRGVRVVLLNQADDPLAELRAGRFVNVGKTMSIGARVDWGWGRVAGLTAARWAYDVVERVQEKGTLLARALLKRR